MEETTTTSVSQAEDNPSRSFDRVMYIAKRLISKSDPLATFKDILGRISEEGLTPEVETLKENLNDTYSAHDTTDDGSFKILQEALPTPELKQMLRDLDDVASTGHAAAEIAAMLLGIVIGLKYAGMPRDQIAEIWGILEATN